jgi:hypothetical protein
MSRGPGRIERSIVALIDAQRRRKERVGVDVGEIWFEVYGGKRGPSRGELVAIRHAMHSVVAKFPDLMLVRKEQHGRPLVITTRRATPAK